MIIRHYLQLQDYQTVLDAMRNFTSNRLASAEEDEIWIVEHNPVFTQGQAGKPEHILQTSSTPIIQTDRGGQVTWHGPGQLVVYFLVDLKQRNWHVRDLINFSEQLMIELLAAYQIEAYTLKKAPGVYVAGKKIGSLGFKIRQGMSYHGLSLNINCDLHDFQLINPCGYSGLEMLRLSDLVDSQIDVLSAIQLLVPLIQRHLAGENIQYITRQNLT